MPGVHGAEVDFERQHAAVEYDPARASIADLVAAIEAIGYRAWDTATERPARPRP